MALTHVVHKETKHRDGCRVVCWWRLVFLVVRELCGRGPAGVGQQCLVAVMLVMRYYGVGRQELG